MRRLVFTLLLTMLTSGEANAQFPWFMVPYGNGYGAASTAASAEGYAWADYLRAEGAYAESTSAALINEEVARGKHIQNQQQWFEWKAQQQRYLNTQRAEALANARLRNARYREFVETNRYQGLPRRLDSSQFDRVTGKVTWPSVLLRDSFVDHRSAVESLLQQQSQSGSTSELATRIRAQTEEFHSELKRCIRSISTQEYLDAYRFLGSLALEGKFPLS